MAENRVVGSTLRREIEDDYAQGLQGIRYLVNVIITGARDDFDAQGIKLSVSLGRALRGSLTVEQIEKLSKNPAVELITLSARENLDLNNSVPNIKANLAWVAPVAQAMPETRGEGVAVAIIDSGIDVQHPCFRDSEGNTRILFLWDQTFEYNGTGQAVNLKGALLTDDRKPTDEEGDELTAASNRTPADLNSEEVFENLHFGVEFNQAQINKALTRLENGHDLPISLRDEASSSNHGTHVAGIAAGNGSVKGNCEDAFTYVGVAPNAHLIIVKIGFGRDEIQDSQRALDFVIAKSRAHSPKKLPVAVNMSYGSSYGHHNGLGEEARHIDEILDGTAGEAMVRAAGNSRNDQSHVAVTIAENTTHEVKFDVSTTNKILFWMSSDSQSRFTYTVKPPSCIGNEPETQAMSPDNKLEFIVSNHTFDSDVERSLSGDSVNDADPDRHSSLKIKNEDTDSNVDSGRWSIIFRNENNGVLNLHLWSHSTSTEFVNVSDRTPADWQRATIGSTATAKSVIAVAAYRIDGTQRPIASFSSAGPAPLNLENGLYPIDSLEKPDIAAPGYAISSARADAFDCLLMCQCCVREYVSMNGTSMAAPHITGVIALMLSVNPNLSHEDIKDILKNNAVDPGNVNGQGPTALELFGEGIVDAEACVNDAITIITRVATSSASEKEAELAHARAVRAASVHQKKSSLSDVLAGLEAGLAERPAWQLVASLISRHLDEVLRLINTQKKVGAIWQRFGGPALVRNIIMSAELANPPIPESVEGRDMKLLVEKLLPVVNRFAGPALQSDINQFGAITQALPGSSLDELDTMLAGKFQ